MICFGQVMCEQEDDLQSRVLHNFILELYIKFLFSYG